MRNDSNNIFFNFSYLALKLLGKGLYSNVWTALSELVANSIDASAKHVYILFDIDDENSSIEILDDGLGMSYEDFALKYVWIGRNKRIEGNSKKMYMGRKGIGKLAALYLSNDYNILSKTSLEDSVAWNLNVCNILDEDTPKLSKIPIVPEEYHCFDIWNNMRHGTYIKLKSIDKLIIGEKTLESLKARFSNFFLMDELDCEIYVGVKKKGTEHIKFELIKKNIAFKNLCAIFSNQFDFKNRLAEKIKIPYKSHIPEIRDFLFDVNKIDNKKFTNIIGEIEILSKGKIIKKQYRLVGWIGIHASINKNEASINDSNFLKNGAYNPNQLRLYVRGKLACENFMEYIKSHQAFSNYIEGEISFDILDDDELEDIATANRQGFVEEDPRILILISIVKPIIQELISYRIGCKKYLDDRQKEYEKSIKDKYKQRIKVEEEARVEAEERAEVLGTELEKTKIQLNAEKEKNELIVKVSELGKNEAFNILHTIYNYCYKINMNYEKFRIYFSELSNPVLKIVKNIYRINSLNMFITKSITQSGYSIPFINKKIGIVETMKEYIEKVLNHLYFNQISLVCSYENKFDIIIKIVPLYITSILDNLVINSLKAHADTVFISFRTLSDELVIDYFDNGDGFNEEIKNLEDIFQFGFTTTENGAGIGMFYVKEYVNQSNGKIHAERDEKGARFIMKWRQKNGY